MTQVSPEAPDLSAPPENEENIVERSCPMCGQDNRGSPSLSYAPEEWPMKECVSCGMVYLEKAWSLDVLYEAFDWDKSVAVEDKRRDEMRGIERRFSKVFRRWRNRLLPRNNAADMITRYAPEGNVLDVGSSNGHYLLQLTERHIPYGVEISTAAVHAGEPAIKARGGRVINKDALNGIREFEENFFSGMIMRSFLEHDILPLPILREACRTLKPGGVLIIKVPNYACLNRHVMGEKWCGFRFPEHVNYFTPESLSGMVREAGMDIRRFNFKDRLPISDNMWLIAAKPVR